MVQTEVSVSMVSLFLLACPSHSFPLFLFKRHISTSLSTANNTPQLYELALTSSTGFRPAVAAAATSAEGGAGGDDGVAE